MSNVQVVVRCRGRNSREANAKSPIVVELSDDNFSVDDACITINHQHGSINPLEGLKTYKVDQVYGSQADQQTIFEKVALPLFYDFVNGLNVTLLCYGQTGTGKTYTMCGELDDESSLGATPISEKSGIIPRILEHMFSTIDSNSDDYIIKCSYVELYNEELKDLLSIAEDDKKLRIYENNGTINIQNLHFEHISNSRDGYNLLKRGLSKRKTASTKLNDVSSRSHAIFTILLYKKLSDDKFTVSKMNLVDLAGSENISRSGALNQRAKEAGSINQSLLTLGRVINSLSSSTTSNHIPYRESKLTRLLQDSLGGSTKTALITTISPAKINVEETISTLDYASKAKNIKNLPQSGADSDIMLKKVLVKNLSAELSKLTYDLIASRNKNGIYLNEQNYKQLTEENDSMKTDLKEVNLQLQMLRTRAKEYDILKHEQELKMKELNDKVAALTATNFSLEEKLKSSEQLHGSVSEKLNNLHSDYNSLKEQVHELREENSVLKANEQSTNNKISDKNTEISKLNSELTKLHSKASNMTKLIYSNLDQSYTTVKGIMSKLLCQTEQTCELVDMYDSELIKNIDEFKLAVNNKIQQINNEWYDLSSNELEATILNFNSIFQQMQDFFEEFITNFENNIVNNKLSKFRFTLDQKLIENHIENNSNIISKTNEEFTENITKLLYKHNQRMQTMISKSISQVGNELVESENKDLQIQQARYIEAATKLFNQTDTFKTLKPPQTVDFQTNIAKIKNKQVDLDQLLTLPETAQLKAKLREEEIPESLIKLGNDLLQVKNHKNPSPTEEKPQDALARMDHVSPRRLSPKNQPSKIHSQMACGPLSTKSPVKRTSPSRSKTKIPQLLRSLSLNLEKENPQKKKRRILEQVDNIISRNAI